MNKKGQVATFIIIGIVLLLITSLTLFAIKFKISNVPDTYSDPVNAINDYIKQCLKSSTQSSIAELLDNGGYTNLDNFVIPRLEYAGDELKKIPLWIKKNKVNRPTISKMQMELTTYINEDIKGCINSLDIFNEQFDIEKLNIKTLDGEKEFEAHAEIFENNVISNLYIPLRIFPKGSNTYTQLENFEIKENTKLLRLYKLASEVLNLQLKTNFLENYTMETVQLSPLPSEGMRFDCSAPITYTYDEAVNGLLKPALKANMDLIRFKNTNYLDDNLYKLKVNGLNQDAKNIPLEIDGQVQIDSGGNVLYETIDNYFPYYDNLYSTKTSNNLFEDIKIRTIVDQNSLISTDFHASPNKNNYIIQEDTLKSKSQKGIGKIMGGFMSLIPMFKNCIKVQHHFYSFNYNTIFELAADNGEVFRFALPINIHRNEPKETTSVGFVSDIDDEMSRQQMHEFYCAGERLVKKRLGAEKDFGSTTKSLDNVNISYDCAGVVCEIGTIKKNQVNNLAISSLQFPVCENGKIIFEKEGYQTKERYTNTHILNPNQDDDDMLIIEVLTKLKKFQFKDKLF